jgi:hypothetical protein
MHLKVKIDRILPLAEGTNSKGSWKKRLIIVTPVFTRNGASGIYHPNVIFESINPICVTLWGNVTDSELLQIGNQVSLEFSVFSREQKGKWYTDVVANSIKAPSEI